MRTLVEVREYKFEDGTILHLELNRLTKKASFVKRDSEGEFVPEKFIFNGRELGYMNGWKNILSAMQYVIDDAKKTMESWDEEEADDFIKLLVASQEQQDVSGK